MPEEWPILGVSTSNEVEVRLTRLQRIITGETSKAAKLKSKPGQTPKAKIQRSRKSRISGKLSLMLQMPMEVFCEIASYLAPLDLLHLAQSTKSLRDLLLSKTARLIWRKTMQAMEIPEGPGDINEPQLVSLLFETFCQGCGAPRVKKVDYGLRVRLCPGCFSLNVIQGCQVLGGMNGVSRFDYAVYRLCCFERASATGPLQNDLMFWPDEIYARQKFFVPDLTDTIHQYMRYDAGSEGQKLFLDRRKELAKKVCAHAVAIHNWESQQSRIKAKDCYSKIESRKKGILKKLKELGYTDEDLVNSGSSEWRNILWQPRELTERIWKSILPQLEAIIATRRRKRAELALSALRAERWSDMKNFYEIFCSKWIEREGKPPAMIFEDLNQLPEVKALVEKCDAETSFGEAEWTEVESLLSRVLRDHEMRMEADCIALITSARESADLPPLRTEPNSGSSDLLRLASSFILWKEFSLFSPSLYTYEEFLDLHRAAVFRSINEGKPPTPSVAPSIVIIACALIRSLGLADTISMAEMEDFGPSFVCKCCSSALHKKMSWKDLVSHFDCRAKWYHAVQRGMAGIPDECISPNHNLDVRADLAELTLRETVPGTGVERTAITSDADACETR